MHVTEYLDHERHIHCYHTLTGHIRWKPVDNIKYLRWVSGLKLVRRYQMELGDIVYIFWCTSPVSENLIKQAFAQKLFDELPGVQL